MESMPHDRFFKRMSGRPRIPRAYFGRYLPEGLVLSLKLDTLECNPNELASRSSPFLSMDMIYAVETTSGELGFVQLAIEHPRKVQWLMASRMLNCITRIHEAFAANNPSSTRIPEVIPVVIYNGARPWNGPTQISDTISVSSKGPRPHIREKRCRL